MIQLPKETTVQEALELLQGQDPDAKVTFARKKDRKPVACWCGCGGTTKSRFVPGHDSKFHSRAKQVARGEEDQETALRDLPHEQAREAFLAHVEKERPKHEARLAKQEEERRAKEEAKQAKEQATAEAA